MCKLQIYFQYHVEKRKLTNTEDTWLWCSHEGAHTKMLFHLGNLVAPKNVVVKTADTDILITALANMKNVHQVLMFV